MKIGVDKRQFELDVQPDGDGVSVRVKAERREDEPLAEVINTGWFLGPKKLLEGARDRNGFGFEQVGVTFQGEAPDEFDVGQRDRVRVDYLDTELDVPASEYVELLGRVGQAATEGAFESALPDGADVRALSKAILRRLGRTQ